GCGLCAESAGGSVPGGATPALVVRAARDGGIPNLPRTMRGMDRIRWTLLALCALRWGAMLVPAGFVWGIDAQRWVAPAVAWPLMAAMTLAVLGALRSRRPF